MDEDLLQSRNHLDEATPPQGCLEPAGVTSADRPLIVRAPLSPTVKPVPLVLRGGGGHNLYGWGHHPLKP
jgi:hypothetical protein